MNFPVDDWPNHDVEYVSQVAQRLANKYRCGVLVVQTDTGRFGTLHQKFKEGLLRVGYSVVAEYQPENKEKTNGG